MVLTVLAWLLAGLLLLLAIPVAVLLMQVLLSLPRSRATAGAVAPRPAGMRLAVLVPAHDEAAGITRTLESLRGDILPGDRILVVADNCSDSTAQVARAAGAEVVERQHATLRAKGYALDFGVKHLALDAPDVVVILDADCVAQPGSVAAIAIAAHLRRRPVQSVYLMHAAEGAGLKERFAEFAWRVKALARPLGYARLGMPCHLMGSGMAFGWELISTVDLATGHLVEDLQLGLDLAAKGTPALYAPFACVESEFPAAVEGVKTQRTRWEHGHLQVMLTRLPALLVRAASRLDVPLLALALDLSVPPLALLVLTVLGALAGGAVLWLFGGSCWPMIIGVSVAGAVVIAVLLAWARHGRGIVTARELGMTPVYLLWKIPIYLRFVLARQSEWVRTKRDD